MTSSQRYVFLKILMTRVWKKGVAMISSSNSWKSVSYEAEFKISSITDNICKDIAEAIKEITGETIAYKTLKDYFKPIVLGNPLTKRPDSKTVEILCAFVLESKTDLDKYSSASAFLELDEVKKEIKTFGKRQEHKKYRLSRKLFGLVIIVSAIILATVIYFNNYSGKYIIYKYYRTLSKAIMLQNRDDDESKEKSKKLFNKAYNLFSEAAKKDTVKIPEKYRGINYGGLFLRTTQHTVNVVKKISSTGSSNKHYAVVYTVSEAIPKNPLFDFYKTPIVPNNLDSVISIRDTLFSVIRQHYSISRDEESKIKQALEEDIRKKSAKLLLEKGYIKSFGEYLNLDIKNYELEKQKEDIHYFCLITISYGTGRPKIENIDREIIP